MKPFLLIPLCLLAASPPAPSPIGEGNGRGEAAHTYYFEPAVSTVSGKLKVELYYGAPGFGEDTANDAKEYSYIFYPDDTINVLYNKGDDTVLDIPARNVIKFQLAFLSEKLSLHPFMNKHIKITGKFFGAITGHHHTDVLMMVNKVKEL